MTTEMLDSTTPAIEAAPAPRKRRSLVVKTFIGLAAMVGVLTAIVAVQPADFRVSRSATIAAPPASVFAQVNDFHQWDAWSPWAKIDPDAKVSFEGPSAGEGAVFRWSGNNEIGEGSMTIIDSQPHERIHLELEFVRPIAGTSDTVFTFEPVGDDTQVTWTMSGKNNFMGKAIGLVMDCEKMVGEQFEKGLASMKAIVEKSP